MNKLEHLSRKIQLISREFSRVVSRRLGTFLMSILRTLRRVSTWLLDAAEKVYRYLRQMALQLLRVADAFLLISFYFIPTLSLLLLWCCRGLSPWLLVPAVLWSLLIASILISPNNFGTEAGDEASIRSTFLPQAISVLFGVGVVALFATGWLTLESRSTEEGAETSDARSETSVEVQAVSGLGGLGSGEMLLAVDYQGAGLIAIDPEEEKIVEVADLSVYNAYDISMSSSPPQIYVLAQNGDGIPVVQLGRFEEVRRLGGVGWNGWSLDLSEKEGLVAGGFSDHESASTYVSVFPLNGSDSAQRRELRSGCCCPYVSFVPNASRLVASCGDTIYFFSVPELVPVSQYVRSWVGGRVELDPSGRFLYAVNKNKLSKVAVDSLELAWSREVEGLDHSSRLVVSPSGKTVWVGPDHGYNWIYEIRSDGSHAKRLELPVEPDGFDISLNGRRLYFSSSEGDGSIWAVDLETRKVDRILSGISRMPIELMVIERNYLGLG